MSQKILSVAIPRPVEGLFTYLLPVGWESKIKIGGWVKVPFGRSVTHAFIVEPPRSLEEIPSGLKPEQLKEITEVGPPSGVIPEDVLRLCRWGQEYYGVSLGEMLHCASPPAAFGLKSTKKEARPISFPSEEAFDLSDKPYEITADQEKAIEVFESLRKKKAVSQIRVGVLQGVTGSGKTEVYIQIAKKVLAEGCGVLVLVPEIALTSQLHQAFEKRLGVPVALWHSAVSDGLRRDWGEALRRGEMKVVVGARSAVFAPIQGLGLIVIDEEHDPTFKQEDRVRYHARDLAIVRAKINDAFVILGSATPSLETRERVREGRFVPAYLPQRIARGGLPSIEMIPLCEEKRVDGIQAVLAEKTLQALRETIQAGEQAMVFLNRRGYASFLICEECGEVFDCPNCSISLTVHRRSAQLRCHVCGFAKSIPSLCGCCQGHRLKPMGAGTESLEEELPSLIPEAKILRLDRDQITSQSRLEKVLEDFREKKSNLLLGTQMLVKGHDFPGVTLVVVILADALFRWPDFRATERSYQTLLQVSGRSGRGEKPGRVFIQAFDVNHPVLKVIRGEMSEEALLEEERTLRQVLHYPPFGRLARIRMEGETQEEARSRAKELARVINLSESSGVSDILNVLGPSEAILEKAKGIYRWDLLLRSTDIRILHRAIHQARKYSLQKNWPFLVDVDPQGAG